MEKILFSLYLLLSPFVVRAQIEISNSIILEASDSNMRQVENVPAPQNGSDLSPVSFLQDGDGIFAIATQTGNDSLLLKTYPVLTVQNTGTTLLFKTPSTNTGSLFISIDSINYFPVMHPGERSLNANEIDSSELVIVTYNGSSHYQLIYPIRKKCPDGFVKVNDEYCIEKSERPAASFYDANISCIEDNAHLCGWGEWYYACQKGGLGLLQLHNNLEWTNDAANEDYSVRVTGINNCITYGCTIVTGNTSAFRCCYNLK